MKIIKIQALAILACAATLFAQETTASDTASAAQAEPQIPCRASFNAIKGTYPKDAAANRIYALTEARVRALESTPKEKRKGSLYEAELKNCDFAVELFKIQLEKVALSKGLDSINKTHIATQKALSLVKDSLINLWSSDAAGARSLNAALSAERNRLEQLNRVKDSLLAVQKAEAEKKLNALQSKTISVYKDARGTILSMSDILFETGKADLKQELQVNLAEIAAILKTLLTESKVTVEGHTDNVGSAEFNQRLSEQRANSVMRYLVERGVEATRLEAVGHGLTRPVAENDTAEGRARNRRVELVIKD